MVEAFASQCQMSIKAWPVPDQTPSIPVRKVLCFEYLHAVPEAYEEAGPSLKIEAATMLNALLQDLNLTASVKLTTLLAYASNSSVATAMFPGAQQSLEIVGVRNSAHLRDLLADFAARGYQILMIAPECDGILSQLTAIVESNAADKSQLLTPSRHLTDVFSDKTATYDWLIARNLPTIPTCGLADWLENQAALPASSQIVIKPRDGVGSHNVRRLRSDDAQSIRKLVVSITERASFIVQPFVAGTACSIGFIGTENQGEAIVLKPVLQRIEVAGDCLHYTGGQTLHKGAIHDTLSEFGSQLRSKLPSFCGYLGVDLLLTSQPGQQVVIVEINPRLCTSYVGYRAACQNNLAELILTGSANIKLQWKAGDFTFDSDGRVTRSVAH